MKKTDFLYIKIMNSKKCPKKLNFPLDSIVCGNCVVELNKFDKDCIDFCLTSPPYDNIRSSKDYDISSFDYKLVGKQIFRVLKDGGVLVWVVNDQTIDGSESLTSMKQAIYFVEEIGFKLWDTMIYSKNSFSFPSKMRYHQIWEYMFVFSKGKPKTFNPIKDRDNKYLGRRGASGRKKDGSRKKGFSFVSDKKGMRFNIWKYKIGKNNTTKDKIAYEHPAIFPEQLAIDQISS